MPDCKACGAWFGSVTPQDLCPTCERALERLKGYAVPVVRCKECEYEKDAKVNKKGFRICPASYIEITDDDFCSYGERKANE